MVNATVAVWRNHTDPARIASAPAGLVQQLDRGRPIILSGRASTESRGGRRAAVQDFGEAIGLLKQLIGMDIEALIPDDATLTAGLAAAPKHHSKSDGKPFTNTFFEVDLREQCGVILLVSAGTGHKLNEALQQPFILYLADMVRRFDPALTLTKRQDRAGRGDWSFAPLALALQSVGGYFVNDQGVLTLMDDGASVTMFLNGMAARKTAAMMPAQTRNGQRIQTGTAMTNGRCDYHTAVVPPAGFGVCGLKPTASDPKERRILFLDTPGVRPTEAAASKGLGLVYQEDSGGSLTGEALPVDQVANVRWVLSVAGRSDWSLRAIADELRRRRFSTVRMRTRFGPTRIISDNDDAAVESVRNVLENLEVYRTGVLVRELMEGVEPIRIGNCFPLDGPWATEEDFRRIDAWMKATPSRTTPLQALPLAGVWCTIDGHPFRMRSRVLSDASYVYKFVSDAGGNEKAARILIPPTPLHNSIVEALAGLDSKPLQSAAFKPFTPQIDRCRKRLKVLDREIAVASAKSENLYQQLTHVGPDGQVFSFGALGDRLRDDFNTVTGQISALVTEREGLHAELDGLEARVDRTGTNELFGLLASFRIGRADDQAALWKNCMSRLDISVQCQAGDGLVIRTVAWEGEMTFADLDGRDAVVVPFGGKTKLARNDNAQPASSISSLHQLRADAAPDRCAVPGLTGRDADKQIANAVIERLLSGEPADLTSSQLGKRVKMLVAQVLGIDHRHWLLSRDVPSDLAQRVTAQLLPALMAQPFDQLDNRIAAYLATARGRRGLPQREQRILAAFYDLAADGPEGLASAAQIAHHASATCGSVHTTMNEAISQGHVVSHRKRGYQAVPCGCGGSTFVVIHQPLVAGAVCCDCRQDRDGVTWTLSDGQAASSAPC